MTPPEKITQDEIERFNMQKEEDKRILQELWESSGADFEKTWGCKLDPRHSRDTSGVLRVDMRG